MRENRCYTIVIIKFLIESWSNDQYAFFMRDLTKKS